MPLWTGAHSTPSRLARAGVVVLNTGHDLGQVVVGAEAADVEHQRRRAAIAPPQTPHEGHDSPRIVVEPHPAQTTERPRTSGNQRNQRQPADRHTRSELQELLYGVVRYHPVRSCKAKVTGSNPAPGSSETAGQRPVATSDRPATTRFVRTWYAAESGAQLAHLGALGRLDAGKHRVEAPPVLLLRVRQQVSSGSKPSTRSPAS